MKTTRRLVAAACLLSAGLIACSPATPSGASTVPSSSADDAGEELVAAACAATTYSNCVKTMSAALDIFAGKLVVVCEYGDGQGGVLAIERREDAEGACSPGVSTTETPPPGSSSVPPGRVVTVVQLP